MFVHAIVLPSNAENTKCASRITSTVMLTLRSSEHLGECASCSAALADSRGWRGTGCARPGNRQVEPNSAFLASVLARIQRRTRYALNRHRHSGIRLAFLASRLALTAAVLSAGCSVGILGGVRLPLARNSSWQSSGSELTSADLPQPPTDPVSYDEVLQSLAERQYGR